MNKRRVLLYIGLCLLLLVAAGCGQKTNTLNLYYETMENPKGACPNAKVTVVKFMDERPTDYIGDDRGDIFMYPKDMEVEEWFTLALERELKNIGCDASYHDTPPNIATDYLITGDVKKAYIKRTSRMNYQTDMEVTIAIAKDGELLLEKNFFGNWEKEIFLPDEKEEAKVLADTLQDFLSQIIPELAREMH